MASTPQFGGTNSVPELNAGQPGSSRYAANQARYVVRVTQEPDRVARVEQKIPQQNVTFEDRMGFEHGLVTWEGTLKTDNDTTMQAIFNELNRALHGSGMLSGSLSAPSPSYMRPTVLKNSFGTVLSNDAVMVDWATDGAARTITGAAPFILLVGLRITFKRLR